MTMNFTSVGRMTIGLCSHIPTQNILFQLFFYVSFHTLISYRNELVFCISKTFGLQRYLFFLYFNKRTYVNKLM
jgi:hypothetical protein